MHPPCPPGFLGFDQAENELHTEFIYLIFSDWLFVLHNAGYVAACSYAVGTT